MQMEQCVEFVVVMVFAFEDRGEVFKPEVRGVLF